MSRLLDEVGFNQPLDRAVERGRPEANLAGGAVEHVLHNAVAVLLPAGEGEHDVEPLRFEREKGMDPGLGHDENIYQLIYIFVQSRVFCVKNAKEVSTLFRANLGKTRLPGLGNTVPLNIYQGQLP